MSEKVTMSGGGGGGAVTSVAGRTGVVTLTAADVGAGQFPGALTFGGTVTLPSGVVIPSGAVLTTQAALDNSTAGASTAYADTAVAVEASRATTAEATKVPKTLTSVAGDLIYASAANTPARLGIGSAGNVLGGSNGLPAWQKRSTGYKARTGALAETYSRSGTVSIATQAVSGTSVTQVTMIELFAGMVISTITLLSGTTPGSGMTHQWFFLADASRVQVATTADDTSTAWSANAEKGLAIAAIASGASSTYTVAADGLYYLGVCVTGTTPTLVGNTLVSATYAALPPIVAGSSDTVTTGPPAFAKTYGALTATVKEFWAWVS